MSSKHYRDYAEVSEDAPNSAFYVDTRHHDAIICMRWDDDVDGARVEFVTFDHDQARQLGMCLLGWTGDHAFATHATHEFKGKTGSLHVDVADGEPTLWVNDGPEFIARASITHDMAYRLICFAGVDPHADLR